MSRPGPCRRKFDELHPRDRNVKTNRRTRIEANWGCEVQDCIPKKIRPRVELKKGAKMRVGDIGSLEEIWWNWSVELLRGLEELSTMMAGKLEIAQELMIHEVQKRQVDSKNPQRRVAELLLGDIQRLVDNVKRHQADEAAKGNQEQDVNMKTLEEDDFEPGPSIEGPEGKAQAQPPEYTEDGFSPDNMISPTPAPAYAHTGNPQVNGTHPGAHSDTRHGTHQTIGTPNMASFSSFNTSTRPAGARMVKSTKHLNESMQVSVTEMRARAARLRGQAMRLEAEALELETAAAMARKALNNS
ncbi:hypothetical protein QM012_007153 [Aureobasidium pullulans]|uniref:Uncharacterized protein n=1 Tax=Aureobasidium pullulans TaxID=5580 RepID=A0ABR0TNL9_AURPU